MHINFMEQAFAMKHNQIIVFLVLIFAGAFLTSCASVSTMQTAGTVPEGEVRWAIASTGTGGNGETKASADPNFEAAVRYGATENFDIGLKVNFLGAQIGAKYQFLRGEFDLSLGLEAGYQWVRTNGTESPSTHVVEFHLPLLMEYHFNPYVGLAFGPKFMGLLMYDQDPREDIWQNDNSGLYVGLMIGLPLRLTDGIWFQPEFNIYGNAYDKAGNSFSNCIWQAGVAVFFGGL